MYCKFSDGTNWVGNTNNEATYDDMKSYCESSGGKPFVNPNQFNAPD